MSPKLPRYKVIQNYILDGITSGIFQVGSQIPTESELATQFDVSRMTVSKAIAELSLQKILTRTTGKGTFIAKQKLESSPTHITDIAAEIVQNGGIHTSKILQKEIVLANESVALALGIFTGSKIYFCELIHYENDIPLMHEKRFVNPVHVSDFFEQDFNKRTPSSFLLQNYHLSEMEHTIEALAANETHAKYLQIPLGSPCLHITRRSWCETSLISFAQFTAPAAKYKLHTHVVY